MLSSRPSPPKPWEIKRQSSTTGLSTSTPLTSTMATTTTTPTSPTTATSPTSSIPRPLSNSGGITSPSSLSRPWDLRSGGTSSLSPSTYGTSAYGSSYGGSGYGSGYGGYGSSGYGSSYGGSGYGSSYGSGYGSSYGSGYGGYGSSYGSGYGGYGSSYGSSYGGYGSTMGGYGSRYGGGYGSSYGSGYGGYGSSYGGGYGSTMGGYGSRYGPGQPGQAGMFQSVLEGGYNQMRNFGGVVEGVTRFSRLLDMNFDAMHGSVGSVLRLLEVAGEFLFAVKSFSFFKNMFGGIGKIGRFVSFLLFGPGQKLVADGKNGNLEFNDYLRYQQNEKRRRVLPVLLVLLGLVFFSAPMFLAKYIKSFREHEKLTMEANQGKGLENAWKQENLVVQALQDFMGQNHQELSFRKDESIIVLAKPYPDWWEGEINGRVGLFPANLTRPLQASSAPVIEPIVDEKM